MIYIVMMGVILIFF